MSVVDDVKKYEDWLASQCDVVKGGLDEDRERMPRNPFEFFRVKCFSFARKLFDWLPKLNGGPLLMSAGDADIENRGTWRDEEGRLVWGVNDFDEAATLPYVCDLVRLSARLAADLPGSNKARDEAIVGGYRGDLEAPGPFSVGDRVLRMQALVNRPVTKINAFRTEMSGAAAVVPLPQIPDLLKQQLPAVTRDVVSRTWQRGGGSLGRPRFPAIGLLTEYKACLCGAHPHFPDRLKLACFWWKRVA